MERMQNAGLLCSMWVTCSDGKMMLHRYNAIVEAAAEHGTSLTLTCVEMCDAQHPPEALCGPEGLLRQACCP